MKKYIAVYRCDKCRKEKKPDQVEAGQNKTLKCTRCGSPVRFLGFVASYKK